MKKRSIKHSNTLKGESIFEKIETMKAFARVGFDRLERAIRNLTE